ncbi:DUF4232 domain-containing protein [Streptomyces sp. NPDC018693]|uniref:DUF4232 domain-containing protein n=1 Tax=unclassified Streptomyces TaxID=2593676 RepID=UPI00379833BF
MRAVPLTVTALAAALLLTACESDGADAPDDGRSQETGTAAAAGSCVADQLGSEVGPVNEAPAAGDTGSVTVTITNTGAECVLEGFPSVRLAAGASVELPRDPAALPQPLTLPEQATASFTITYVRGEDGRGVAASAASYALPDDSAAVFEFPWSYGDVARTADGAVDATVSAFQQEGD